MYNLDGLIVLFIYFVFKCIIACLHSVVSGEVACALVSVDEGQWFNSGQS